MARDTLEQMADEKDPSYQRGYKATLDYFMLQLMAKDQRVSDRLYRLTGEGEEWKK